MIHALQIDIYTYIFLVSIDDIEHVCTVSELSSLPDMLNKNKG